MLATKEIPILLRVWQNEIPERSRDSRVNEVSQEIQASQTKKASQEFKERKKVSRQLI